jgi:UBA-like domain
MATDGVDADALAQFVAISHASPEEAEFFLSASAGDVQRALDMYLSGAHACACVRMCIKPAPFAVAALRLLR